MPNMTVIRPADANETREAWKAAILRKNGPTLLSLTRQAVPTLDRGRYSGAAGLQKGAYVLADLGDGKPEIILMASGSEVYLVTAVAEKLAAEGRSVRVVSFPSWELFEEAGKAYQNEVLPASIKNGWQWKWQVRWDGNAGPVTKVRSSGLTVMELPRPYLPYSRGLVSQWTRSIKP